MPCIDCQKEVKGTFIRCFDCNAKRKNEMNVCTGIECKKLVKPPYKKCYNCNLLSNGLKVPQPVFH